MAEQEWNVASVEEEAAAAAAAPAEATPAAEADENREEGADAKTVFDRFILKV